MLISMIFIVSFINRNYKMGDAPKFEQVLQKVGELWSKRFARKALHHDKHFRVN